MCKKLIFLACVGSVLALAAGPAIGGVAYPDPAGGWTYVYTGEQAAVDLDGTWDHDNGSDQWDGTAIGEGSPGGVSALTEGATTFVRFQDTGDPRDYDMPDPSNRKVYLGHSLANEIDAAVADTILDSGATISFRARLATTPPLDDLHPAGGAVTPWAEGGDGSVIHDGGKGSFGICQANPTKSVSFCLALASDDDELDTNGLLMNKLNGAAPTGDVDVQGDEPGTVNILPIEDLTAWHEFWIVIEADASGQGTHAVTIYMDGDITAPSDFILTAGSSSDLTGTCLELGLGATPQTGAMDVDFYAYAVGAVHPPGAQAMAHDPSPPNGAMDVVHTPILSWIAGDNAASHKVYFADNFADVNDGTAFVGEQTHATYDPLTLDLGQTYFWRIDEINTDATITTGKVWQFTVAPYVLVDDFEDYNDFPPDRVFDTWPGGYTAGDQENNGSIVGHLRAPFAEQTIVSGGEQSMPVEYDNSGPANISEAIADVDGLKCGRDWTIQGIKALTLWFRGNPEYVGSFTPGAGGSYTMTGAGAGIEGDSDAFHFAFKEVSGASTIAAKVDSISDTDASAKAGVMIRDTLDPNSPYAMICVTPGNGLLVQHRNNAGDDTTTAIQRADLVAPQWVQLQRTVGGLIRAFYSADGSTWIPLGIIATVRVNLPVHVGLAMTSSNINATCVAEFSNVSFPDTSAPGQWTNRDIGIISNEPEPMYVALSNSNGTTGEVYHDDPNATLISTWTRWNIDLKDFSDQGVDLSDVDKVIIGFGNRDAPQPGGEGMMYFDDIRLYPPRCVLDEITPLEADFTDDCIVDYTDLQMMAGQWLEADYSDTGTLMLHWAFNDGPAGTTASDSSGNNRAGVISGATWVSPGQDGTSYCLDFMGASQDVNHPGAGAFMNGLHGLTVSVWVNSELSETDRGIIIFSEPDGTDNRDLRYDAVGSMSGRANVIKCGITSTDGIHEIESSADMQVMGQWQHLAMTWQRYDPVKLYINGQLDDSSTDQPLRGGTLTGYDRVLVGKGGKDEDPDTGWDGRIDDVRIYNYALSADQIATVMAGGSLPEVSVYYELISPAELYGAEEPSFKAVNFRDLAILADQWQEKRFWPEW
jgi:hypothetical protein